MEERLLLYLLIGCTLAANLEGFVAAKARHYKFEVGYIYWSPDCEERMMIGINGKFPGPTIRAKAGDTIVIELKNSLPTEGVVIHWHGIKQLGTPWADGTASISQRAINPDETFVYRFQVDKAGTYFYHGHYGMQRAAGLYGSLIVDVADGEEEPFHYDGEQNLLLSDWWHENVHAQMLGLTSIPFHWVGESQTILINGRGQYNCSLSAHLTGGTSSCKITNVQCAPVVLQVHPNKTYRVRIASTTSLSSFNLAIGNHKMTVVEADGNYVEPVAVDDMDIYSGESYSVLITSDQNSTSNYWISIGIRGRPPKTQPALAILNYYPNSLSKLSSYKMLHLLPVSSSNKGSTKPISFREFAPIVKDPKEAPSVGGSSLSFELNMESSMNGMNKSDQALGRIKGINIDLHTLQTSPLGGTSSAQKPSVKPPENDIQQDAQNHKV